MRTRSLIVIAAHLILCATAGGGTASAQNAIPIPGLSIVFPDANPISMEPGGITSIVFRLTSTLSQDRALVAALELPDGWDTVVPVAAMTVPGLGSTVGITSVRTPRSAPAGRYILRLVVRDPAKPHEQASASAGMVVSSTFGIDLTVSPQAEYVRAGSVIRVPVTVTNRGNAPVRVRLEADGPPEAGLVLDSSSVRLGPMESRSIRLTMSTDADLTGEAVYQTYVSARAQNEAASFKSASFQIHVLPTFGRSGRASGSSPLFVSLQSAGDERSNGTQFGMAGQFQALNGNLGVEMLMGTRERVSMFGSRRVYRATYVSDFLELEVGDQVQNLSPLTTTGEAGAGIGARVTRGKVYFRGFAQRSRYAFPEQALLGTSLGYRPGRVLDLSLNAMRRQGNYEGTVASARGILAFGRGQSLDLECGLDSGAGFSMPSCIADARGRVGGLTYSGRLLTTAETYPGLLGRAAEKTARVTYRFPIGLNVEGVVRTMQSSLQSGYQRAIDHGQIGVGFNTRRGSFQAYSRVQFVSRMWGYSAPGFATDRKEELLRLQLGAQTGPVDLHASVDAGHSRSASNGIGGPSRRYRFSALVAATRAISVSARAEYGSDFLTASIRPVRTWMLNLESSIKVGARTELSATLYRNIIETTVRQPHNSIRIQAKHTFRSGQELALQFQYSAFAGPRPVHSTDYRIAYSIPVGIPVGRSPQGPMIQGRVYDADSGVGLDGILFFLGTNATISDESGRFMLPRPADGSEYLTIDQRSIGYENVTMVPMPYRVRDLQDDVLEIPVMRSASVRGSVSRYGSPTGQRLLGDRSTLPERLAGIDNVIIAMTSGTTEYRARTGSSGSFVFKNVAPGEYIVRIVSPTRLAHHHFEPDSLKITVGGGAELSVEFRAMPERAQIRMAPQSERMISISTRVGGAGSVAKPETETTNPPERMTDNEKVGVAWDPDPTLRYTLIVESSTTPGDELRIADQLAHVGLPIRVFSAEIQGIRRYLTAVGQFASEIEALLAKERHAAHLPADTWLFRIEK